MNLSEAIDQARVLLQDTNSAYERYSDTVLLDFGNQTLKRMALLRPDLFSKFTTLTCTTGAVVQTMPTDCLRLMEVLNVVSGSSIRETNRQIMDDVYPSWASDSAAEAINWMRHPRDARKFFIYPKSPAGQQLYVEYSQSPPDYDASTTIELLPDGYFPTLVDGIVFLAESIDNEHVNSGRAELFQKSFSEALAANLAAREVTDKEKAGIDEKAEKQR